MDFEENNINKEKIHIKSKKNNNIKSTNKKKKIIIVDNSASSSFRNNYKNYQYDYEEDFYEPR